MNPLTRVLLIGLALYFATRFDPLRSGWEAVAFMAAFVTAFVLIAPAFLRR